MICFIVNDGDKRKLCWRFFQIKEAKSETKFMISATNNSKKRPITKTYRQKYTYKRYI